jgi:hypothetical protein
MRVGKDGTNRREAARLPCTVTTKMTIAQRTCEAK